MTTTKAKKRDTLYNNGLTQEENNVFKVKTANFTQRSEMRAQDSLPKLLRDAINNSSIIKWSSVTVVELLNEIKANRPFWTQDQCVVFAAQCINNKNNDVFYKACQARDLFVSPLLGKTLKK